MKKYIGIAVVLVVLTAIGVSVLKQKDPNILYEFDGEKVTAEAYYEKVKDQFGVGLVYQLIEKEYLSTISVTDEEKKAIKASEDAFLAGQSSEEQKEMLDATLKTMGYEGISDLNRYLTNIHIKDSLIKENYTNHLDAKKAFNAIKPRSLTHVLVLATRETEEHQKANTPSSEESAHMRAIDAALRNADDVKMAMIKQMKDDEVTSESYDYVDKYTSFVPEFLEAALKLEARQTSGWVKTSYGYHRIYIESTDFDKLSITDSFIASLQTYDATIGIRVVLDELKKNNATLDSAFEKELLDSLGGKK